MIPQNQIPSLQSVSNTVMMTSFGITYYSVEALIDKQEEHIARSLKACPLNQTQH